MKVAPYIMQDRSVSVSLFSLLAALAWLLLAALVVASLVLESVDFGVMGPAASAVAATLSVRGYCRRLEQNMQAAFDVGRDLGRRETRRLERI